MKPSISVFGLDLNRKDFFDCNVMLYHKATTELLDFHKVSDVNLHTDLCGLKSVLVAASSFLECSFPDDCLMISVFVDYAE